MEYKCNKCKKELMDREDVEAHKEINFDHYSYFHIETGLNLLFA